MSIETGAISTADRTADINANACFLGNLAQNQKIPKNKSSMISRVKCPSLTGGIQQMKTLIYLWITQPEITRRLREITHKGWQCSAPHKPTNRHSTIKTSSFRDSRGVGVGKSRPVAHSKSTPSKFSSRKQNNSKYYLLSSRGIGSWSRG